MITRNELVELLYIHDKIVEFAIENFDMLKKKADNAEIINYGTDSTGLGCLYPGIRKKICKGQYGRILKNKPNAINYTIYEFDNQKTPLRIKHIGEEKYSDTFETLYFFQYNDGYYAVPFMGESDSFFISNNCYRFAYADGKLSQFAFFSNTSINLMEFDYTNYPHIHMLKHDYLTLKYNPQKEYQYKIFDFYYDEDEKGRISNLIQGNTSILS